jgi:hypothetical protein
MQAGSSASFAAAERQKGGQQWILHPTEEVDLADLLSGPFLPDDQRTEPVFLPA